MEETKQYISTDLAPGVQLDVVRAHVWCGVDDGKKHSTVGGDTYRDVEFFADYNGSPTNTVMNALFNDHMLLGTRVVLQSILEKPIHDAELLVARQQAVRKLLQDCFRFRARLKQVKHLEKDVLWMFQKSDTELKSLYEIAYFSSWLLEFANKSTTALTLSNIHKIAASPVLGIITPITYIIAPYVILKYKVGLSIGFRQYANWAVTSLMDAASSTGVIKWTSALVTIALYFHGLFNSFQLSRMCTTVTKAIVTRASNCHKFLSTAAHLHNTYWSDNNHPFFMCSSHQHDHNKVLSLLDSSKVSLLNFGSYLKWFRYFKPGDYTSLLQRAYMLDAVSHLAYLTHSRGLTFAVYEDKGPALALSGFWHPCLTKPPVVVNDIGFQPRNCIITGPNAAGKSTAIKAIIINILMAQTVGLVSCQHAALCPFKYITSQINIPDCKGFESLFQAEMYRCKRTLDLLREAAANGETAFIAIDEIFSSTNPIEGVAGSYAILKKMGSFQNSMSVVSTHHGYLCLLAQRHPHMFANLKMEADLTADNISFDYKLKVGRSKQYIALELLKHEGFEHAIMEEAIRIKHQILAVD